MNGLDLAMLFVMGLIVAGLIYEAGRAAGRSERR
jgi:hypothetical protein